MAQHLVLPDPVLHDLSGAQRNFESLLAIVVGLTDSVFEDSGSSSEPTGLLERVAFILIANDRVYGPTSIPPTVDDAYSMGFGSEANGERSISFGTSTIANGDDSYAGGNSTIADGDSSHTEGLSTSTTVDGEGAHAEGVSTEASAFGAHAEGESTFAQGEASHAEGESCTASGEASHAEGLSTLASGDDAHAEGQSTQAVGNHSHAEGSSTTANAEASHAGGADSTADFYAGRAVSSHSRGQYDEITVTRQTTNATPADLLIGGFDPITVPNNEMWMVVVEVAAKQTAGSGAGLAGFRLKGAVGYPGGVLSLVDVPTVENWGFGGGLTWSAVLDVDGSDMVVTVTGEASKTIKWFATVHITRVH